jgi:hypothetical protein
MKELEMEGEDDGSFVIEDELVRINLRPNRNTESV